MKTIILALLSIFIVSCNSDYDKLLEKDNAQYRNIYIGQSFKEAYKSYDLAYKDLNKIGNIQTDTMLIENSFQQRYSFYTYSKKQDWFRSVYFEIKGDTVSSIQQINKDGRIFVQNLSLIPDEIYIPKIDY